MSRIGRMPITVPAGVEVKITADNEITVKGKNGTLTRKLHPDMIIKNEGGVITVERPSDDKEHRSLHGLTRTLIANMVEGVTNGFSKTLEIVGVGYKAVKKGNKLVMNIGFSHPIELEDPEGITTEAPDATTVIVKGIDKAQVGNYAANIRAYRRPEPYKGKGIKYDGEVIRRKEGKTGASS